MRQANLKLNLNVKKTRKQVFLSVIERVMPWVALIKLIAPYYSEGKSGRLLFPFQKMPPVQFIQQWFTLFDPSLNDAFLDNPMHQEFAQLEEFCRLPNENTILRFRHRLEMHKLAEKILGVVTEIWIQRELLLKTGATMGATLIAVPSPTKNKVNLRELEMHSRRKANRCIYA